MDKKWTIGWIEKNGWIQKKWMVRCMDIKKQMYGWLDGQKNRWMAGWIETKQMDKKWTIGWL